VIHADVESVSEIPSHPLVHVGASDAGAHIAQFCGAGDTCYLIERFVREYKKMSLERAVERLTGELARDWGIADRGVIAEGKFADLVLFDPETIARGPEVFVSDVPGDGNRYLRSAKGIEAVIVNGALTLERGAYTAERAVDRSRAMRWSEQKRSAAKAKLRRDPLVPAHDGRLSARRRAVRVAARRRVAAHTRIALLVQLAAGLEQELGHRDVELALGELCAGVEAEATAAGADQHDRGREALGLLGLGVQRLAVAEPDARGTLIGLDLEQARLVAHLEHLQHHEDRHLGQVAAERVARTPLCEQHGLLTVGIGQERLERRAREAEGDRRRADADPIARLERARPPISSPFTKVPFLLDRSRTR
jgi:hypothetical protein